MACKIKMQKYCKIKKRTTVSLFYINFSKAYFFKIKKQINFVTCLHEVFNLIILKYS